VSRCYYATTPIYYANAEPHIGHTYTTLVLDTLLRWHRAHGAETWSVSGTDEHGEKMVEAAAKHGVPPAVFTERISSIHQRTWAELGLSASHFVRTTDPRHVANVQRALSYVYERGWIEQREYEGLYCVGCERFLTERDMEGGLCRDHERAPEPRRETNYFFRMSREFAWLREYIETHPGFIRPERFRNEALAMLRDESGLGDLSISRPKTRLDWGVELPFDRAHVCYVWFDALLSYLTGAGWPDDPQFAPRWANVEHLIGKDILKPHAIFWPIMLKALDLPPYQHLSVHGYWTVDERKVSKSLGNMISPLAMRERYGFELFRYFLLREMSFGLDASFSEAALVERVNADLANNLGNLVSRTLNLVEKWCGGVIPEPGAAGAAEAELVREGEAARAGVEAAMAELRFHDALTALIGWSGAVNRYVDGQAPWQAAKQPGGEAVVRTSLATAARHIRGIAEQLSPFVPGIASEILRRLGGPGERVVKGEALVPRLEAPAEG
jgi:methionyl-tRNA synthetase